MPASLVDVARLLGISPSTVSRAFNHPTMLRPDTVARVQAAAAEIGYVPNSHARALITGRSGAVGLIVPDITNPFFPKLVRHAQRAAENAGLSMFVAETTSDPEQERRHLASLAPQTEGVIVASSRLSAPELRQIGARMRLVLINNDTDGLPRVLISSRAALREGIIHLHRAGRRRFLYLGGPRRSWSDGERRDAVATTAAELGVHLAELRVESGTYTEAHALAPGVVSARADAVIAFDDVLAHGIMHGLQQTGIDVPADVAVLGCDDALPIRTFPSISTIALQTGVGLRAAMDLVMAAEPDREAARIEVPGRLELRDTTP